MQQPFNGILRLNEPMANYTSWRVGGPADRLYQPKDIADLCLFIKTIPEDETLIWVGLGSNLLVRDGGIRGTVINTQGSLKGLSLINEVILRAEAGVSCAQVARYSARLSLKGLEFMAGIPGTIGGALAMNAGCFGSETWQYVKAVECLTRKGDIVMRSPHEFEVSYRCVKRLPDEWFIAGHFELQTGEKEKSLNLIRQYLQRRSETQPTSDPTCGSVFQNPTGDFAGRLIQACGLKNFRNGQAAVSEKHANFIVNLGNATARDIESLINHIIEKVEQQTGIRLHPEVHFVGFPSE
ncbi:MAG: UDP-N-acetylenolpyruvoylglucosamine reductase [Legionellaceae bacterium]